MVSSNQLFIRVLKDGSSFFMTFPGSREVIAFGLWSQEKIRI